MNKDLFPALEALCMMWEQYCGGEAGHVFMSAGEQCQEVLSNHGLLKNETACSGDIDWEKLENFRCHTDMPEPTYTLSEVLAALPDEASKEGIAANLRAKKK